MRGLSLFMAATVGVSAAGAQAETVTITFDELPRHDFTGVGPKVKGVQFIASGADHMQVREQPWTPGSGTFGETNQFTDGPALGLWGDDRAYFFVFDEPVTSFSVDIYAFADRLRAPIPDLTPSSSAGIFKVFEDPADVFTPVEDENDGWRLSGTPLVTQSVILTEQINGEIHPDDNDQAVGLYTRLTYSGGTYGGFAFQQTVPYIFGGWIDNITYTTANGGNGGGVIPTPAAAGLGLGLMGFMAGRRGRRA